MNNNFSKILLTILKIYDILTVLIQVIQLGWGDMMINLDYKDGRTLHEQIEAGIKDLIINGVLTADEQLPSVRELSVNLTVNPNTVQRAYKQLEIDGFIYSVKGKGNFVAPVQGKMDEKRAEELYLSLTSTVKELMFMGEDKNTIESIINNIYAEREDK